MNYMEKLRLQGEENKRNHELWMEERNQRRERWLREIEKAGQRKESLRQAEFYEVRHFENQSDSESVSDPDVKGN